MLRLLRDVAATAAAADASSSVMTPSRSVFLFFFFQFTDLKSCTTKSLFCFQFGSQTHSHNCVAFVDKQLGL